MPQPLTQQEVYGLIAPALTVLWSIHLDVQGHPCRYLPAAEKGINGLLELMERMQNGDETMRHDG